MIYRLPNVTLIKDGLEIAKSFKKGVCKNMNLNDIINELISMYLTDKYEINILRFEWKTRKKDIIVKRIKWDL